MKSREGIVKFGRTFLKLLKENCRKKQWHGMIFSKEEIRKKIHLQEQYFDSEIVM